MKIQEILNGMVTTSNILQNTSHVQYKDGVITAEKHIEQLNTTISTIRNEIIELRYKCRRSNAQFDMNVI